MKLIRNAWVLSGAAALGLAIAGCSSKTTDNGAGTTGNPSGGANSGGGGGGVSPTGTGGKISTSANTGGAVAASTGGSTAFNALTYCNGILNTAVCSQTNVQADVRNVNMLIVLDESGSMNDSPSAGAPSKWEILKQALNTALTSVDTEINFGLLLFPYKDGGIPPSDTSQADNCAVPTDATAINVPITTGPTGLQNVLDKVAAQTPGGGTPTASALAQAYTYFTTGDGKALNGSKWVLLATDGGPNCNAGLTCTKATCTQNLDLKCGDMTVNTTVNCCDGAGYICLDDVATTSQIARLAAAGVKTFVVGIPGSEAYANSLNSFAAAGQEVNPNGGPKEEYYAVSANSALQDLTNAFKDITTQLVKTCDIPLPSNPKDNTKVNVAIDCVLQTKVPTGSPADAAGVDGFYIDNSQDPAHIKLVGAPCNAITTVGAHHVDVIQGCTGVN